MEGRYEVAIIGTGPAGLEAALTLKNRNKNFVLLGSRNLSNKVEKAHAIQNYLGLPNVSGKDMMKAFQDHIDSMGIEITEERVSTVYAMGDYFALQAGEGMIEAEAVILATGVVATQPCTAERTSSSSATAPRKRRKRNSSPAWLHMSPISPCTMNRRNCLRRSASSAKSRWRSRLRAA